MILLNVLVEGKTELRFVKEVVAPHLGHRHVFAYPIAVLTSRDRRAHVERRGGVLSYRQVRADLLRLIKRDGRKQETWFTTMVDLYRLPSDFPGYQQAARMTDPWQRVASLEKAFADDVNCHRFIPYIQLHEYEALILSDPSHFVAYYDRETYMRPISDLQTIVAGVKSPEEIDDGATTAPSKRIIDVLPAYEDDKAHAGPRIAASIGLPLLRERCPHFNEWLSRIEGLEAV